jgi:hypothetical protein
VSALPLVAGGSPASWTNRQAGRQQAAYCVRRHIYFGVWDHLCDNPVVTILMLIAVAPEQSARKSPPGEDRHGVDDAGIKSALSLHLEVDPACMWLLTSEC